MLELTGHAVQVSFVPATVLKKPLRLQEGRGSRHALVRVC